MDYSQYGEQAQTAIAEIASVGFKEITLCTVATKDEVQIKNWVVRHTLAEIRLMFHRCSKLLRN